MPIFFYGQDTSHKILLTTWLHSFQKNSVFTFTYANESIEDVYILAPKKHPKSKESLLLLLENDFNLNIKSIGEVHIVIIGIRKQSLPSAQNMQEVFIKQYLTKGISITNKGQTKINQKELVLLPGAIEPDVLQSIQYLPGILSVDESISNINIRGGGSDQNTLLWDGYKIYQSGLFFGLISAFNPFATEEILITKNGTSSSIGDGVSGVINMRLDSDIQSREKISIGSNLLFMDLSAKLPVNNKFQIQINARRSIVDLIQTHTYKQYSKRVIGNSDYLSRVYSQGNENLLFWDLGTKIIYKINTKEYLEATVLSIHNTLDINEISSKNILDVTENSSITQQSTVAGFSYSNNWTNHTKIMAQGYASFYNLDSYTNRVESDQSLIQENRLQDYSFKCTILHEFNKNINADWGFQYNQVDVSNNTLSNAPSIEISDVKTVQGVYLFSSMDFDKKATKVNFGLRINPFFSLETFRVEPRFSYTYLLNKNFKIQVLGEFKSQITSQSVDRQNDFLGIENRRWILSDAKEIPVIKSKQLSFNLNFNRKYWSITSEFFIKKVTDLSLLTQDFTNYFQGDNAIGSFTNRGVELLFQRRKHKLDTWLSYTFNDNSYHFSDWNEGERFSNNLEIKHSVQASVSYELSDKLQFGMHSNWHSGKPFTPLLESALDENQLVQYTAPNSSRIKDYFRTNFSMEYDFFKRDKYKLVFGMSVWNVFNTKNITDIYYTPNVALNRATYNENIGLNRTFNFAIRLYLH